MRRSGRMDMAGVAMMMVIVMMDVVGHGQCYTITFRVLPGDLNHSFFGEIPEFRGHIRASAAGSYKYIAVHPAGMNCCSAPCSRSVKAAASPQVAIIAPRSYTISSTPRS